VKQNLIIQQFAAKLDPLVSNDNPPKWHVEAHDVGLELGVSRFKVTFPLS
jgi:mediator of RNA polymerase II transcription subunit 5